MSVCSEDPDLVSGGRRGWFVTTWSTTMGGHFLEIVRPCDRVIFSVERDPPELYQVPRVNAKGSGACLVLEERGKTNCCV